jgi:hypothetical protein
MSTDPSAAERHFSEPRGIVLLWAGLLLAPAAWALQFAVIYALVPWLCRSGAGELPLLIASLVGAAVGIVGVVLAFNNWRRAGSGWRATGNAAVDRARFLAVTGLLLGSYVVAIIVMQAAVMLGTGVCQGYTP